MRSRDIREVLQKFDLEDQTPERLRALDGRIYSLIGGDERRALAEVGMWTATVERDCWDPPTQTADEYWAAYAERLGAPAYATDYTASLRHVEEKGYDWIMANVNGQVGGTPYAQVGYVNNCYAATALLSLWLAYFRLELGDERPEEDRS